MKSLYPLLCTCGLLATASAQTAPAAGSPPVHQEQEEVVVLSPFVVQADDVSGYQATSTLAGTRLKSSLKDLSTTISVVTPQFLEDTGSNNMQDLLVYTAATEIPGVGGNMAATAGVANQAAGDVAYKNPDANNRIRSLASADLTRDYFATAVGFDSYNTERVEINRGANSILFGLGSPAGLINYGLIKPVFKDKGKVTLSYGSYDSIRSTLDLEKVLIPKKLSLRLATVLEDKKFQQEPAFLKNERLFGVVEYRPLKNTTIRLSGETGTIEANRPRQLPPMDSITTWFLPSPRGLVKETHNPTAGRGYAAMPDGTRLDYFHAPLSSNSYTAPTITFAGPDLVQVNPTLNPGAVAGHMSGVAQVILSSFPTFGTMTPTANLRRAYGMSAEESGFYTADVLKDTSIFDFRNKLLDGPNKSEDQDFEQIDFSVDQLFFNRKAGVNYSYHQERFRSLDDSLLDSGGRDFLIGVDVNTHMTNGAVNTNFGRPFTSHAGGFVSRRSEEREAHRLTGFFETDLRKRFGLLGRLLGRQVVTGLADQNESSTRVVRTASNVWDSQVGTLQGNLSNTNRVGRERYVGGIVYLGDSLANATSAVNANISNIRVEQFIEPEYLINIYNRSAGQFQNLRIRVNNDIPIGGQLERLKVSSQALVWQNYFFDELLVATAGWRWDDVKNWVNNNPPRNTTDNSVIADPQRFFLPETPTFDGSSRSSSLGWVAHLPRSFQRRLPWGMDLSLHYGKSENTQLGSGRSDFYGNPIAPPSGETTELGGTLSLLDNRLSLRINRYETTQLRQTVPELAALMRAYIVREDQIIVTAEEVIAANPFNQADIARLRNYPELPNNILTTWRVTDVGSTTGRNIAPPPGLAGTTDLQSKGLEIELVANVTKSWTLMANVTQAEAVRRNTGLDYLEYVASRAAALKEFGPLAATALGNNTVTSLLMGTSLAPALKITSQDGRPLATEIREWRFNLASNYRFSDQSRLKGWNVGSALRWQDKVAIGFPLVNDPSLGWVLNTLNPYYGPAETNVDAWIGYERALGKKMRWKAQLNVRNALNDDDLIPVTANPDGTIPVLRIPAERTWEMRVTLLF